MQAIQFGLVMSTVLMAVSTAPAAVYPSMNVTFDGMTAGSKPGIQAVPSDGSTLTRPTLASEGTAGGVKTAKIYIRDGFGGQDPANQVLVFENSATGARSDLSFDCGPDTTVTTGAYKLSFNLYTTGDANATGPFWINLRGNPTGGNLGPIIASFGIYLNDAGAKVNNNSVVTLTENTPYHFDYIINLKDGSAGTASIYLNGTKVLGDANVTTGSILRYVTMGMDQASTGTVMIDEVTLTAVPEPATIGLLSLGATALLIQSRRR